MAMKWTCNCPERTSSGFVFVDRKPPARTSNPFTTPEPVFDVGIFMERIAAVKENLQRLDDDIDILKAYVSRDQRYRGVDSRAARELEESYRPDDEAAGSRRVHVVLLSGNLLVRERIMSRSIFEMLKAMIADAEDDIGALQDQIDMNPSPSPQQVETLHNLQHMLRNNIDKLKDSIAELK